MDQLQPDFKDFLKLLNDHGVEYLVIGGYAVNYYGYSRPTNDFDVWIETSEQNAEKLIEALDEFGFPDSKAHVFLTENKIFRMGLPPVRIEVHTTIEGVKYDACRENREIARLDDIATPMIGLGDLIKNKKSTGRLKDLADVEYLTS